MGPEDTAASSAVGGGGAGGQETARPALGASGTVAQAAADAVTGLVRALQVGWDARDAEVSNRHFAADLEPVAPADDISGAFSEMAMYVLVRRGQTWWLAAGQNTLIRPVPVS